MLLRRVLALLAISLALPSTAVATCDVASCVIGVAAFAGEADDMSSGVSASGATAATTFAASEGVAILAYSGCLYAEGARAPVGSGVVACNAALVATGVPAASPFLVATHAAGTGFAADADAAGRSFATLLLP